MQTRWGVHICKQLLAVCGMLAAAAFLGQPAIAGIVNSKHDLSTTSTATTKSTGTEVCVFCHTPHGASSSAPLWNRGPAATSSFTVYSSGSMTGEVLTSAGGGSVLCLSCHDGATALDLLINAPGSGGYTATTGLSAGYTWSGNVGGLPANLMTGIAAVGEGVSADLSNDHPIGVPYCGGVNTGACADPDFFVTSLVKDGTVVASPAATLTTENWWINTTGSTATREKADLPLYVRTFTAGTMAAVECATCHEPHTSTNATFLRVTNGASGLCLKCHDK